MSQKQMDEGIEQGRNNLNKGPLLCVFVFHANAGGGGGPPHAARKGVPSCIKLRIVTAGRFICR
jgi:hypothetical protein